MQPRALIFDVDGTLAETEELHRHAFNAAFAAQGLPFVWDRTLYARLLDVTGGKERINHFLREHAPDTTLSAQEIAALHADKTERYAQSVAAGGLALRRGVARLIREAEIAGIPLAIATTTSRPNVDALLRATLGRQPFRVIAAGDEVSAKKPSPEIYVLALRRLGLPAEACVAFEDTVNGVRSAQDAGLRCVVTVSAYGGAGPFPDALTVVDSLGEPGLPVRTFAGALVPGIVDLAWLSSA